MKLEGRALYNLLRMNWLEDRTLAAAPWQIEDYRELSTGELLSRLKKLGISLAEESFLAYAENVETPEELADCLWVSEEDLQGYDQAYLLLFELWRRLLPHRQALSIFCDELDRLIALYDKGELFNEEPLQKALVELENILDTAVDDGAQPKEAFHLVTQLCAHDLERFLYDYIADQIDESNNLTASELIDGFYEYISNTNAFAFLRARLFAASDLEETNAMLRRLLEQLEEEPDLDLLFEIASFLVHTGDANLFVHAVKQAVPLLKVEEEFQELLLIVSDYYRCLDQEDKEKLVQQMLSGRAKRSLDEPFSFSDRDVKQLGVILKNTDWSEV